MGAGQRFLSGPHGPEGPGRQQEARRHKKGAQQQGEEHGGMDAPKDLRAPAGAVVLGDDDHRAAGQAR